MYSTTGNEDGERDRSPKIIPRMGEMSCKPYNPYVMCREILSGQWAIYKEWRNTSVLWYRTPSKSDCIARIRELVSAL